MQKIDYIKIQNFKTFGDEVLINFDNPTVLIGANNSGKTTIIQAIALWSWAVKIWRDKKGNSKSHSGVGLNRLEIAQVPIKETRYFWNNARVRQNSNDNIGLTIKLGIFYQNQIREVGMLFKYHSPDLMYCQPTDESFSVEGLLAFAAQLPINLLYPMSGISDREFILQEDAIRTQIGSGQTATVIRNICYHLESKNKKDWAYLVQLMEKLFLIDLKKPLVRATGAIEVLYNYKNKTRKTDYDLDITLAGRGQQQMLLVLAYLLNNRGSVLMIDEPDAHLEILRQTQIFTILKEVASLYDCQVIIVTHSEAVLNEANTVVFVMDGKVEEISDKQNHKFIRNALKDFGIEHYYKAKLNPRILYIEGSTDKDMLKTFADKFNHSVKDKFDDRLNFYYTQAQDDTLDLDIKGGANHHYNRHFQAIKIVVKDFKGIAIFDGDNKNKPDNITEDLAVLYWKRYELENYFISPKAILAFARHTLINQVGKDLFNPVIEEKIKKLKVLIEKELILPILNNDQQALFDFNQLPESLQNVQFQNLSSSKKLSSLLENIFEKFAIQEQDPLLLRKGNFYELIDFIDQIPIEVEEKLNYIEKYLS